MVAWWWLLIVFVVGAFAGHMDAKYPPTEDDALIE